MDNKSGDELPLVEEHNVWMKIEKRPYKHKKKTFIGWGSEQLIGFLSSIGKHTDEPLTQVEVYDIIKDYIGENKLIHPQRKKKVLCDTRLRSLFGRKAVNRLKISNLLEAHFAESQESEDDFLFGSEEENVASDCKRQRILSDPKTCVPGLNDVTGKVSEAPKSGYAAIVAKNVKLVYLRRSLIEDFLKNLETLESKVMDCFVRVKSDPYDFSVPKNFFRLEQVTGIGKALEAYNVGAISTDIVLQVSNMTKGIHIFMLSDDDFSEEECEDLHRRVKQGLLKRFTIGELDKKARSLYKDITNHWIDREIVLLQKRIDRANEKGWRRELFEYIERRELLQTPAERSRLLKEVPKIIADAELELEVSPDHAEDAVQYEGKKGFINQVHSNQENKGSTDQVHADTKNEGNGALSLLTAKSIGKKGFANQVHSNRENKGSTDQVHADSKNEGNGALSLLTAKSIDIGVEPSYSSPRDRVGQGADSNLMGQTRDKKGNVATSIQKAGKTGTEESTSSIYSFFFGGNGTTPSDEVAKNEPEGNGSAPVDQVSKNDGGDATAPDKEVARNKAEVITAKEATSITPMPASEQLSENKESRRGKESLEDVIDIDEDVQDPGNSTEEVKLVIPVIDLDDDNDEEVSDANGVTISRAAEEPNAMIKNKPETRRIWHYIDPNGETQGPFSIHELRIWKYNGYFDENFKVWITGRTPEDAILLNDAIRLTTL